MTMDAFLSSPVPSRIDDLTDEFVEVTLATADHYAKRIARTLNLPASDIDDVRQDLLVEVLRRYVRYDPTRAAWTTLVELITRHAAGDLATDLMQSRTAEVGSIDDVVVAPDGSRTSRGELLSNQDSLAAIWSGVLDPYAAAEQRIDLERFITGSPIICAVCAVFCRRSSRSSRSASQACRRPRSTANFRTSACGCGPLGSAEGPREKDRVSGRYIEPISAVC